MCFSDFPERIHSGEHPDLFVPQGGDFYAEQWNGHGYFSHAGSWVVLLAGAIMGLGFGNFQSLSQVSGISLVPRERFAQATSTIFIFFDLGVGMAPYLSGFLVQPVGYAGIFAINAAVVALTIPLYWVVWKNRPQKLSVGHEALTDQQIKNGEN